MPRSFGDPTIERRAKDMNTVLNQKAELHHYLRGARQAVRWKLDGLSEYAARSPRTPTGTNLLGLVKHLSGVEMLYFGWVFDRPFATPPDWFGEGMATNADMWATADESVADIVGLYDRACAHADGTIDELAIDSIGFVPWLGGETTLHRILVHVLAETERHAGHLDIVRELTDGAVGRLPGNNQMAAGAPESTERPTQWWAEYRDRIEQAARLADTSRPSTKEHR